MLRTAVNVCLALVLAATFAACNKMDTGVGPSPIPIPIPNPGPGPDTTPMRMVDGAGNPGPLTVSLKYVSPGPGSQVTGNGPDGVLMAQFEAEVCMDPVPNPTNSPNLSKMRVIVIGSADGVTALGPTLAQGEGGPGHFYEVPNGGCAIVKRRDVPGSLYIYLQPGAKYLLFAAGYGNAGIFVNAPAGNWALYANACPSNDVIAGQDRPPSCTFRAGHFLDYRW